MQRIPHSVPRQLIKPGKFQSGKAVAFIMGWSVITPLMILAVGTTVLFGLTGGGWQVFLSLLGIFLPLWVVMTSLLWWNLPYQRRQILKRGRLVRGTIVERRTVTSLLGNHWVVVYNYRTSNGQVHRGQAVIKDRRLLGHAILDEPVAVIYMPEAPKESVAPALVGASFLPVVDQRPAQLPQPTEAARIVPGDSVLVDATLHNPHTSARVGWLTLRDETLFASIGDQEHTVPLDKPFRLELSAWLLSPEEVALGVLLRASGVAPTVPPLRFAVPMPQENVSLMVPLKHEEMPQLYVHDFNALWPVILSYAHFHNIYVPPWVTVPYAVLQPPSAPALS